MLCVYCGLVFDWLLSLFAGLLLIVVVSRVCAWWICVFVVLVFCGYLPVFCTGFDFGFGVGYVDCGVGGLFSVNLCLRLLFGLCFGCLVLGLLHCEFICLIVLFWIGCFVVVW